MKCTKCGIEFFLPKDLNNNEHKEDESYYECAKCKKTFCKNHIKMKIINSGDEVIETSKIQYINLCEECEAKI